jgi:hypothetical protein
MHFRVLAIASLIALAGCSLQADPPGAAPSGVAVAPGDGRVTVTWNQEPDLTYWIFYQTGTSVTPAAPGATIIRDAVTPRIVANLANGTQYAFVMNATKDDSAAGPASPVFPRTPRLAGADWTSGTALGATSLNGIAFSGSRLVAVGDLAAIFAGAYNYTSANPPVTDWTQATSTSLPPGFTEDLSAVTYSSQFVALGINGSILTSSDGLTWTSATTITTGGASMSGIVFGLGLYVAVGDGGKIFTSSDLVTWNPVTSSPTLNDLYSVSFLNGGFVATGASGALLISPDGVTWPPVLDSNTANALRGAAFRATPTALYVVVGDAGTVVTSTDGTNWTATALAGAPNLRGVTSGGALGTRFLAVGLGGAVVFSDDGASWSPPSVSPGPAGLARVLFAPAMYVAVGAAGANAVSK